MDFHDTLGLQFLDLNGVDEFEKNRVLLSLQPSQRNNKFPWLIGDRTIIEKNITRTSKVSLYNDQNQQPSIQNGMVLPYSNATEQVNGSMNNQFYNNAPTYQTQAVVSSIPMHISQNYVNYSVSNPHIPQNHIVQPCLPHGYSVEPQVIYSVPPGPPVFVPYATTDPEAFYQYNPQAYVQNVMPQNAAASNVNTEPDTSFHHGDSDTIPIQTNSNIITLTPEVPQIIDSFHSAVDHDSANVASEDAPVVAPLQNKPAKSWASLFGNKGTPVNGSQFNGVTKSTFQAVNKESNNKNSCPIKNPSRSHFVDPDCYRMGEFLSSHAVNGKTISLQPRGLINQSNYCYINSILQALIACPPMYNLLTGLSQNISSNEKRKPTPVIDGMCKFVNEFNHLPAHMRVSNRRSDGSAKKDSKKDQGFIINTDIPFEPSWIYRMLNGIRTDLIEGRQEDAEEFLGCLLNNLNDEMLELIKLVKTHESNEENDCEENNLSGDEESWQTMGSKNKGSILRKTVFARTPISDIFGGSLKSRIHRTGDHSTENTQPFFTLQLNIENVNTVREALEALTTKYQLEGLTSSKTNQEVEAWQQVMLDELPVVLILHLKCFDFQLDGCTKIIKALEFPIDLKIDAKLLSSKTSNAKEKQYKLFAVVYHDGKEATKGHYVTDAFHVGYSSWLRYDDASVKQVQEEQVLNPQGTRVPYLLFYRRSDTIRSR